MYINVWSTKVYIDVNVNVFAANIQFFLSQIKQY